MIKIGYDTTGVNALARSFSKLRNVDVVYAHGTWFEDVQAGDICIFSRGSESWQGHVGVAISTIAINKTINIVSFNRTNTCKIEQFKTDRLIEIIRPN